MFKTVYVKKTYRLPDDLTKAMEEDAKHRRLPSENEYVIQALRHYLKCANLVRLPEMKLIVLQYPAKCKRCGKLVPAFNYALYGRSPEGGIVICMDCYVGRIGDKAIVAKFLKMREYRQIVKALKAEADRLADRVDVYGAGEKHQQVNQKRAEILGLVHKYLTSVGSNEEKEILENLMRKDRELDQFEHDIEQWIAEKVLRPRKRERKKQTTY